MAKKMRTSKGKACRDYSKQYSLETADRRCSKKQGVSKFHNNHRKTWWPETCNFLKEEAPTQVFSCKYFEIFKNSFFIEHLRWLLLFL